MCYPHKLWAARDALVIKDRAIIWADAQRSAPLGYARRGRTLRVGEKEREKGQVVSVIVSGKVAYISMEDILIDEDRKKVETEESEQGMKKGTPIGFQGRTHEMESNQLWKAWSIQNSFFVLHKSSIRAAGTVGPWKASSSAVISGVRQAVQMACRLKSFRLSFHRSRV
jgi:hypothetical protein